MHIDIAQKLRPFSHRPRTQANIPGTHLCLVAYPTRIDVEDVSGNVARNVFTMTTGLTGPVDEFTVQQDLEKGNIVVWGRAREGFFRFRFHGFVDRAGFVMSVEKLPEAGKLSCKGLLQNEKSGLRVGQSYSFYEGAPLEGEGILYAPKGQRIDRLSLGSNKAQNWEQMCDRGDFSEIFPLWHRLGQMMSAPKTATTDILEDCRKTIADQNTMAVLEKFREVFAACFDGVMAPRLFDLYHHGIPLPEVTSQSDSSPLAILTEGAELIRSLFVQVGPSSVALLPVSPPEFHSGRMLDVACGDWGILSFEWTKKAVRRVVVTVLKDTTASFSGRTSQKTCRLRLSTKDRGTKYTLGEPLTVAAGTTLWFDNFQK